MPVFALLGAALPRGQWADLGWKGPTLVVTVLILRRIPAMMIMEPFVRPIRGWDEALFVGWFGPIGVSALYLAVVAHQETQDAQVWAVVTLLIAVTIVLHDLTTTPVSQWLGRRVSGVDHDRGGRAGGAQGAGRNDDGPFVQDECKLEPPSSTGYVEHMARVLQSR